MATTHWKGSPHHPLILKIAPSMEWLSSASISRIERRIRLRNEDLSGPCDTSAPERSGDPSRKTLSPCWVHTWTLDGNEERRADYESDREQQRAATPQCRAGRRQTRQQHPL